MTELDFIELGKKAMSDHKFESAAKFFRLAIEHCPPENISNIEIIQHLEQAELCRKYLGNGLYHVSLEHWEEAFECFDALYPIVDNLYPYWHKTKNKRLFPHKQSSLYGYIDMNQEWIIPEQYQEAYKFKEGLGRVKIDDKIGFVDRSGTFMIYPQYDQAEDFEHGTSLVTISGEHFVINRRGTVLQEVAVSLDD